MRTKKLILALPVRRVMIGNQIHKILNLVSNFSVWFLGFVLLTVSDAVQAEWQILSTPVSSISIVR